MTENCDRCSRELFPGKTSLEIWRGEELIILRDVPADVCHQCGEAYLSARVSEKLDAFLDEPPRPQPLRYVTVPEFSLAQAVG